MANPRLAGGVIWYIVVMVLSALAFRLGGALTVLYPIDASAFFWAALIAWCVYRTPVAATNLLGITFLISGMLFAW